MLFIAMILSVFLSGCVKENCQFANEFNHPKRPASVKGWNEFKVGETLVIKGQFVLKKGESTNNGKVGIKVLDLSPAMCFYFREPQSPEAKLQFFNVESGEIICQGTFRPGATSMDSENICGGKDLEWSVLSINDINANENWVFFDLR